MRNDSNDDKGKYQDPIGSMDVADGGCQVLDPGRGHRTCLLGSRLPWPGPYMDAGFVVTAFDCFGLHETGRLGPHCCSGLLECPGHEHGVVCKGQGVRKARHRAV